MIGEETSRIRCYRVWNQDDEIADKWQTYQISKKALGILSIIYGEEKIY